MLILLLLASVKTLGAVESTGGDDVSRCPGHLTSNDYLQTYDGKCYQVITTQKKWFGAKAHCAQQGGDLVTIERHDIQLFVEQSLTDLALDAERLWIGATDTHREHHWTWVTGENVSGGYTNWQEGSPSCYLPPYLCREDCAVLLLDKEYQWFQTFCSANDWQYGFICQYEMQPGSTTATETTITTTMSKQTATVASRVVAAALSSIVEDEPNINFFGGNLEFRSTKRTPHSTTTVLVPDGTLKETAVECNSHVHRSGIGIRMALIGVFALLTGMAVGSLGVHFAKTHGRGVVAVEENPTIKKSAFTKTVEENPTIKKNAFTKTVEENPTIKKDAFTQTYEPPKLDK